MDLTNTFEHGVPVRTTEVRGRSQTRNGILLTLRLDSQVHLVPLKLPAKEDQAPQGLLLLDLP